VRLTLHWRGKPLLALDLTAQSPDDTPADHSLEPPMGLSASGGGVFDKAEPMQPDTAVFGFGTRPESETR
jgi:hypothetical protein